MVRFIVGFVFLLHGMVHLLYSGQSMKLFELQSGMVWPEGSWVFSKVLGETGTRSLGTITCALAALVFLASAVGVFFRQTWWHPVVVSAGIFSTILFILFWDGQLHRLDNQGGIAILINLGILVAVLIFRWPQLGY